MISMNIEWNCRECGAKCAHASAIKSPGGLDGSSTVYFETVASMLEKQTQEKLCMVCEDLFTHAYKENIK